MTVPPCRPVQIWLTADDGVCVSVQISASGPDPTTGCRQSPFCSSPATAPPPTVASFIGAASPRQWQLRYGGQEKLSEEPWKAKQITLSEKSRLISIQGEDLLFKFDFVRDIECGANTNFQKVFDLILQVAVNRKLKEDQMIKKVFVFSHMEFDVASGYNVSRRGSGGRGYVAPDSPPSYGGYGSQPPHTHRWETDYQAITRKFAERGYGSCVPEIVLWNLKNSKATPVPGYQQGVSLVSGYSKNLVTLFLEEAGILNPDRVLRHSALASNKTNPLWASDAASDNLSENLKPMPTRGSSA
ncbi:hypothetical protein RJ639_042466 [Escallonia herrerae]|uniref:DUF7788 domain-containing protein n=1 Tax=Escallonia herrerae TaxID=1293975 RepID=A0AA88WH14_9ASTE|nr:hypothetical protein RJ639_042466 [Escallonia herrerae]